MKNKTFPNKLKLNKETISKLDQKKILGGATLLCSNPCVDTLECSFFPPC